MDLNLGVFYVGLDSGIILTFDVRGRVLLSNAKLIDGELFDVKLTSNGQNLILADSEGLIIRDLQLLRNIHILKG